MPPDWQERPDAGLRNLPGLFLIEIDRGGETITPVSPQDKIQSGDHLVFTGVVTTIADLERIPGLVPAVDSTFEARPARADPPTIERGRALVHFSPDRTDDPRCRFSQALQCGRGGRPSQWRTTHEQGGQYSPATGGHAPVADSQ